MSRIEDVLADIAARLRSQRFALVGGLAVSVHCEPRFTRDIDICIDVASDAEAEALVREIEAGGYRLFSVLEQEVAQRLAASRLLASADPDDVVVDLLFASSGIESEVTREAEPEAVFPGVSVPVAKTGHLIALKLLSEDDDTRPQDAVDLRALIRGASDEEIKRAQIAVEAIETRGFHRNRDLVRAFEDARRRFLGN